MSKHISLISSTQALIVYFGFKLVFDSDCLRRSASSVCNPRLHLKEEIHIRFDPSVRANSLICRRPCSLRELIRSSGVMQNTGTVPIQIDRFNTGSISLSVSFLSKLVHKLVSFFFSPQHTAHNDERMHPGKR